MGAYEDVFQSSVDNPEAFWLKAAESIDWHVAAHRGRSTRRHPPFYRWFPDGELNTCHNALDRHVDAGRGEQAALIYDSPVTGTQRTYTYRELRDEVARVRRRAARPRRRSTGDRVVDLHADGARGGRSRCWPAPGSAPCTRSSSAGSPPTELAARIDDARPDGDRVGVVRHRAGQRVVAYKPLLDAALELADAQAPPACVILQRAAGAWPSSAPAATSTGPRRCRPPTAGRLRARRGDRPALHPLHLGHHRQAQGRRPRQRRPRRRADLDRCRNVYDVGPGESSGPPPTSAGSSATPTSSTRRCWPARPPCSTRASRSARPTPARSGGSSPSTGQGAVHRADRDPGDQEGGPATASTLAEARPAPRCSTCSWPASGSTPTPTTGRADLLGIPVDRPLVADRDRLADRAPTRAGIEPLPIKPGSPTVPMPGYDVQVLDATGRAAPPARTARSCVKLPLPPGTLPTLWGDDERYVALLPDARSRATTSPATAATSTTTATSS